MTARPAYPKSICWVGISAVVLVPLAHLDGIYRFALLPQVAMLLAVALAGLVIWILQHGGRWQRSPLVFPAIAFLTAEALSTLVASNRVVSLLPVVTHLGYALLFLALLCTLDSRSFSKVLKAAAATGAVLSAVGLAQYLGWGRGWVPTAGFPSSTLGHRNIAAAYLIGVLPFTLWAWTTAKRTRGSLAWSTALGLEVAFLLATRSRGAWVSLAAAVLLTAVALAFSRSSHRTAIRRDQVLALSAALLLAMASAFVPAAIEKGKGEAMWEGKRTVGAAVASVLERGGDKGRLALWNRTLEMIADRPIMGVGAGNWRLAYPTVAQGDLIEPNAVPHRPHNEFLGIWAETGLIGLLPFLLLLWTACRMGLRRLREGEDRVLVSCLLCGLLATVANSSFSFPKEFPAAWLPFYLSLAGIGLLCRDASVGRSTRRVLWVGVAALVAGILIVGRQIGFDHHALQVRLAFAQSRWHQVIRSANDALAWGPFDEEAYLMRGRARQALGSHGLALSDYRTGLSYHPNSAGLWNGSGNALRAKGDLAGARRAYHNALLANPGSGSAYNNLGTLHAASGAMDSALAAYQKAVGFQPGLADAHANLSIVHRRMGDTDQAMKEAERALKLEPENLEALNALGSALLAGGRLEEALGAFTQALEIDSTRAGIHYNIGRVHELRGDPESAGQAYRAVLRHWQGGSDSRVDGIRRRLENLGQNK